MRIFWLIVLLPLLPVFIAYYTLQRCHHMARRRWELRRIQCG